MFRPRGDGSIGGREKRQSILELEKRSAIQPCGNKEEGRQVEAETP
jgi:hypothetical protein